MATAGAAEVVLGMEGWGGGGAVKDIGHQGAGEGRSSI